MRFFLLCSCISIALAAKLPSSIQKCHRNQPDLPQCVARAIETSFETFKNGNKELGLPQNEPYFVKEMNLVSDSSKQFSSRIKFVNVTVRGTTKNIHVDNVKINLGTDCNWIVDTRTPQATMEGDYEMEATILFPIKAHGKFNSTMVDYTDRHTIKCEFFEKNGKKYMKLKSYTMDLRPSRVIYYFQDIFPTNRKIEADILNTMNENSLDIFKEIKPSFDATFSKIYMDRMNIVLSQIPFDDMFL
ncbi:protein takeout-like [Diorhabda carinulata]|uniref:protein takeout-like n=1 Tax=Diorhabda carinulata TaxID=1163345 RepID=UPI0025A15E1C|nr:protein takeout-like [Diorhabda carinulata]